MGQLIEVSTQDELDTIISENDVVLIEFFADWCPPCVTMKIFMEEIADETEYTIAEVDTEEHPEIVEEYSVRSNPTNIIMKNGVEVKRFTELVDKDDITTALETAKENSK